MNTSSPTSSAVRAYRFERFEARLASGRLLCDGERVPLPDKAFQVLTTLLESAGEVVSRQQLCDRLWPDGTFVDFDNNLNANVRKLREALADSAAEPRFIETLPRRGYRFLVDVEPVTESPPAVPGVEEQTDEEAASKAAPASRPGEELPGTEARRWRRRSAWIAAAVLVVLLLGWQWTSSPTASPPAGRIMLVVLPFSNLDGDPTRDFFSDGMTEELITHLGRLDPQRLGVIAGLSALTYKDSQPTSAELAETLGAHYVLSGSVRGDPQQIRISAKLIQLSDETTLWTESYDRPLGDVLTMQSEIATRVARSLAVELLPDDLDARARSATVVTAAYEQYLRGRHQWRRFTGEGYRHATAHFGQAIALDPDFAQAHAGLADAYNLLAFAGMPTSEAFPRAARSAKRALELDPDLAEAHNALAFTQLYFDYQPQQAERSFRRALELAPNYAMAWHWRAGALSALQRHDEAIAAVEQAVRLDPVALSVESDYGWYFLYADRYQEGLEVCTKVLDDDPHYGWARACRDEALHLLGRDDEILDWARQESPELWNQLSEQQPGWQDDPQAYAAWRRAQLSPSQKSPQGPAKVDLAMDLAAVGEHDRAVDLLEVAYEERNSWLVFLRVDPRFDPLHGSPRYEQLCQQMGLP